MKRIRAQLKKDLNREPTRQELAEKMKTTADTIEDLEILSTRTISLSDRYYDDDVEVGDRISDSITPSVEYQIVKNSIQEQIRRMLNELDDKEALVLKLRFGLLGDRPHTLQEIGDHLGLTRERIRQIEKKAMRKLSHSGKLQQLRGYLN
jgi:RNA polymerase primary sigma factor